MQESADGTAAAPRRLSGRTRVVLHAAHGATCGLPAPVGAVGGAALLRLRARLNRRVRGFFEADGFVEVETPLLAPRLIPEPSIAIFATEQHYAGGASRPLYLTPSPELWMKRLVAAGMPRVYQLARSFRNVEEQGAFHRHEFTMLEWYTAGESYRGALTRSERLLAALDAEIGAALGPAAPPAAAAARPPLQRVTMSRLWRDALGLDPAHASAADLRAAARRLDLPVAAGDTWEQLFNRIFLTCIEPLIAREHPVAVLDYPARIPTLAQTAPGGAHARRWELYLAGVEVANCFQEETGAAALASLFAREAERQAAARVAPPPDLALARDFAAAGACSGVAVGLDRLYALLLGLPAIAPIIACADLV